MVSWATFIGDTPPLFALGYSPSLVGYCEMVVSSSDVDSVRKAMRKSRKFAVQDVKTNIRMLSAGPPVDKPVQNGKFGPVGKMLSDTVKTVKEQLRNTKGTRNVNDDRGTRVKRLKVTVNEDRSSVRIDQL